MLTGVKEMFPKFVRTRGHNGSKMSTLTRWHNHKPVYTDFLRGVSLI